MPDRKYQKIRWVRLKREKALINSTEKIKILSMFIRRKAVKEKIRERALFFACMGVVRFRVRRR